MSDLWLGIWIGFGIAALASQLGLVVARIGDRRARPTQEWVREILDEREDGDELPLG